jgi:4-amino-4-deoxy-L-arabinose transferase-like glycosyltransferase
LAGIISIVAGSVVVYIILSKQYSYASGYVGLVSYLFPSILYARGQVSTEIFAALFISISLYFHTKNKNSSTNVFLVGLSLGLGGTFKQPVGIVFIGILFYYIYDVLFNSKYNIYKLGYICLGAVSPFIPILIFYFVKGEITSLVDAVVMTNLDYGGRTDITRVIVGFYKNMFSVVWLWGLSLMGVSAFFVSRDYRNKTTIFSLIALVLSLIPVMLRPYPHYLIQCIPSLAIFAAIGFKGIKESVKYEYNLRLNTLALALSIFLFIPTLFGFAKQINNTYPITRDKTFGENLSKYSSNDKLLIYAAKPQYYFYSEMKPVNKSIYYLPVNIKKTASKKQIFDTIRNGSQSVFLLRKKCIKRFNPLCRKIRSIVPKYYDKKGEIENQNATLEILVNRKMSE